MFLMSYEVIESSDESMLLLLKFIHFSIVLLDFDEELN